MSEINQLPLFLTAPHSCSYLEDLASSNLVVDPDIPMDMALYTQLLQLGFRRSGSHIYRPHCSGCKQCVASRIPVADFQYRRRHRRVMKMNASISAHLCNDRFQEEHYRLYQRYTASRHQGGGMAESSPEEYRQFLTADWSDTLFIELRDQDKLLGVAVTDQAEDGLSALYTFFDPDLPQRSLGVTAILTQLDLAQRLDLPYLYLGYWIGASQKMRYKTDYRPVELYIGGKWQRYEHAQTIPDMAPATNTERPE